MFRLLVRWCSRVGLVRLYFLGLSLLIMAPLLPRGFILTQDMVFTPRAVLPPFSQSSYWFYALLRLGHFLLPMDVLQKLLLCLIPYLAGTGFYRLGSVLLTERNRVSRLSLLLGGSFFVVNPFTYSRFMAGQFAVLLGYALLPWFVLVLYHFHHQPNRKHALRFGVLGALIAIVSIHSLGMIILAAAIGLGLQVYRLRHEPARLQPYVRNGTIMLAVGSLLSLNWLVPLLAGRGTIVQTIQHFNRQDQQVFATAGGNPLMQFINILHLQGFWPEIHNLYRLPQSNNPLWGLASTAILLLVGYGLWVMWQRVRAEAVYFYYLAGMAVLFALGGLQIFRGVVPLLSGYREPHKFVGLVALVFSLAISFAIYQGSSQLKRPLAWRQYIWALGLWGLFWLFTPTMVGGFAGQLRPVDYPAGWYAVDHRLGSDSTQFNTLFLPWHQYMSFAFARNRIIANPAPHFFGVPVLSSDNPEFGGAGRTTSDQRLANLSRWLKSPDEPNMAAKLARHNIKYVILARELDYSAYNKMVRQTGFQPVYRDQSIELYRNEAWRK